MMIRPVDTLKPTPIKPAGAGEIRKPGAPPEQANQDLFLQELLMGAGVPPSQQQSPAQPLEAGKFAAEPLSDEAAPEASAGAPREAKAPVVDRRLMPGGAQAALTPERKSILPSSIPAVSDKTPDFAGTPPKPASILAAPPQNEELRQILAEAFPEASETPAAPGGKGFSVEELTEIADQASESPRDLRQAVRDSKEFLALQGLPSELKLKAPVTDRTRNAYAKSASKPAVAESVRSTELPSVKRTKTPATQPLEAKVDLSSLEQVLTRQGEGAPISLPATPEKALPKIQIDGHVTTGSMARERLSSESVAGLRGAVQELSRQGGGEIQIRLKPEALGEIKLQVATRGSQVGIKIQAENPQAARVIEQSLDSLRDRLRDQNLKLGHIEFSSGSQNSGPASPIQFQSATEPTPTWNQPIVPQFVQPDSGSQANLGQGRNSSLEQDREDGPARTRAPLAQRGLRSASGDPAGRLNVLA